MLYLDNLSCFYSTDVYGTFNHSPGTGLGAGIETPRLAQVGVYKCMCNRSLSSRPTQVRDISGTQVRNSMLGDKRTEDHMFQEKRDNGECSQIRFPKDDPNQPFI